jgi:acetyl-CoA C-acetyltransferase
MNDVVVVAAKRTAVGKFGGAFNGISAVDLGAAVMQNLLETTRVPREQIDEVILGQVLTAGAGQNPARQSAIKAGLPVEVPAMTVNMVCGSSLKAIMLGAQAIKSGDAQIVIAGGQENMSMSPHVLQGSRNGLRMGDGKLIDSMIVDGLRSEEHTSELQSPLA